jgi:hypothetical protein
MHFADQSDCSHLRVSESYPRPRLSDLTFAMKSRTTGSTILFFSVIIQCFCVTTKFGEQSLCVLEILRVKALGEAAIDRAKQIECFGTPTFAHQEPGKVYRGTEL